MKTKHFKVKIGYGKDEYISIPEKDLQMAIRAQITGKVALFDEGSISGNHIISITPDFNRLMGYNRDYELTGEDYDYVGKKAVEEHRMFLEESRQAVLGASEQKRLS